MFNLEIDEKRKMLTEKRSALQILNSEKGKCKMYQKII